MKERLTKKENVLIATMLFGLFFGAGNLIFPAYMGQLAGKNMWQAIIGFVITGVGLPLLGIAAMGISRSDGLMELSSKVSRPYSYFFTCALYLTIGPFFAIPRCATTPFTVAVATLMPEGSNQSLALAIFSFLFFAIVLAFSLKPGKILTDSHLFVSFLFHQQLYCFSLIVTDLKEKHASGIKMFCRFPGNLPVKVKTVFATIQCDQRLMIPHLFHQSRNHILSDVWWIGYNIFKPSFYAFKQITLDKLRRYSKLFCILPCNSKCFFRNITANAPAAIRIPQET